MELIIVEWCIEETDLEGLPPTKRVREIFDNEQLKNYENIEVRKALNLPRFVQIPETIPWQDVPEFLSNQFGFGLIAWRYVGLSEEKLIKIGQKCEEWILEEKEFPLWPENTGDTISEHNNKAFNNKIRAKAGEIILSMIGDGFFTE